MALPTPEEVYNELEGFGITRDVLSEKWVENKRDNIVVPFVERTIRVPIQATSSFVELYDGLGTSTIILRRRPVISITSIFIIGTTNVNNSFNLTNVELDSNMGVIKMKNSEDSYLTSNVFTKGVKNIKVTYVAGFSAIPNDIKQAIIMLTAELCLGNIANRTGGGNSLSTQGFTRQFGDRGKYSAMRNDLSRQAMDILRRYMTGVV